MLKIILIVHYFPSGPSHIVLKMASEEHKLLSQYIKDVHLSLRKSTLKLGADAAWQKHCSNEEELTKYAQCMKKLATTHWESNCNSDASEATSRITWVVEFCTDYFNNSTHIKYREKELNISEKMGLQLDIEESFSNPLKLLDIGSCYNPFRIYDDFDVLAIDLCPANTSVMQCDFLNVNIGPCNMTDGSMVTELQENSFDVVTFCFVLEYIPSSELRILACQNAYKLLKPGGLLIINTPDSKHVGANSKIIKCWRYTLAHIGFNRIKYEKAKYMHCMAFRKSLHREIAMRWALLYKEPYMKYAMHIPQDFTVSDDLLTEPIDKETLVDDFQELPFSDLS
ncbi:S-adenosylmethionine sensor upstream of mTORC1 [Helicoverpa zea]|uniref:S-adenosylmethionine sensor upstream of mTORC1 n=1 Tax=Helicoverpa zea TaxID=7113 RepID=UPI001F573D19|nr:S-adenosylmethionine sensor upstream of mTORC1 [Helicoverpa zea]